MEKYKVTCLKCKHSDVIVINNDSEILWGKNTYIISGRKRLDLQFGWQCFCGNNDLLSNQEVNDITDKQKPDSNEINSILKNIKTQKSLFYMEKI